ncbi:MAG: ABC transporter permease [Prochlorococcaceae cyanobacterium]|jgi:lipopolysaccharide transport system permease protein
MLLRFPKSLWDHRELWWRLTEREILGRYRGSILGLGWTLVTPLAMLTVYTFVFSQIFQARWGGIENAGPLGFAVHLFAGLIVFNLFSECVNRAPGLVLANPNYVKKVIFPLDVLGSVAVASSCFHACTSLLVLLAFQFIAYHRIPLTFLWLPIVWIPLVLCSLASTWILAAAGVFLRDIGQLINVALNMLMFLSPIFFPYSALPPKWQPVLGLNPLAQVIEQTRRVLLHGLNPQWPYIIIGLPAALFFCEMSFRIFQKSKKAFADTI